MRVILEMGKASTSTLQRRLRIGYGQATRILDRMQEEGIIGPPDHFQPRPVLKQPDWLRETHKPIATVLKKQFHSSVLQIFLCHSSGDKDNVRQLYKQLSRDGFSPWLDEECLLPGQEWEFEIRKAVRNSKAVLVCLSHSSVTKEGFVQKEIRIALDAADEKPEGAIYIIPLRLEDCLVPERLEKMALGRSVFIKRI